MSIETTALAATESARVSRLAGVSLIAAVIGALSPLMVTTPAPLQDWPSHIARVQIIQEIFSGDTFWLKFYQLNTFFLPNVAVDIGLLALGRLGLDIDTAAGVFLAIHMIVFIGGFCALAHAVHVYEESKPLIAAILAYTGPFFNGLLSYQTGIALALWFCAAWFTWRNLAARWLISLAGGALVFFCHLAAAALFALILFCFECTNFLLTDRSRPHLVLSHLSFVPAAVIIAVLLLQSPSAQDIVAGGMAGNIEYINIGGLAGYAAWKLDIFPHALFDGIGLTAAVVTSGGLGICGLLTVLGARLRLPIASAAAAGSLLLAVFFVPERVGTGAYLDYRLALLPLLIAAAMLGIRWHRPQLRFAVWFLLILILLVRTSGVMANWREARGVYADFARQVSSLPRSARIFVGYGKSAQDIPWAERWRPVIGSMTATAVSAHDFVSTVFAFATQQPLVLKPELEKFQRDLDVSTPGNFSQVMQDISKFCPEGQVYLSLLYPPDSVRSFDGRWPVVAGGINYKIVDACPGYHHQSTP